MSVTVSMVHTVEVAGEGAVLAHVDEGVLYVYPEGLGRGPMFAMAREDWARISREVMFAFQRADRPGGSGE